MSNYRTLEDVGVEYLALHPDEIDPFLAEAFAAYARSGDTTALLAALRIVARIKGISALAREIGMSRRGLQRALSGKGQPRFNTVYALVQALGYHLMPVRASGERVKE